MADDGEWREAGTNIGREPGHEWGGFASILGS